MLKMAADCRSVLKFMSVQPTTISELRDKLSLPSKELEDQLSRLECEGKVCSSFVEAAGVSVYWAPELFSSVAISQTTPASTKRKSPFSNSSRLRRPFKSPMQSQQPSLKHQENLEQEVTALKEKLERLEGEIEPLQEEYHEEELQEHIDKLHEYNEIKDIGQLLIGKLAELSGTTTRSMYDEFGLDLED